MTVQPAPDETPLDTAGPLVLVRRTDGEPAVRLGTAVETFAVACLAGTVGPHPLDTRQRAVLEVWRAWLSGSVVTRADAA